jgi:hypothetical protein
MNAQGRFSVRVSFYSLGREGGSALAVVDLMESIARLAEAARTRRPSPG